MDILNWLPFILSILVAASLGIYLFLYKGNHRSRGLNFLGIAILCWSVAEFFMAVQFLVHSEIAAYARLGTAAGVGIFMIVLGYAFMLFPTASTHRYMQMVVLIEGLLYMAGFLGLLWGIFNSEIIRDGAVYRFNLGGWGKITPVLVMFLFFACLLKIFISSVLRDLRGLLIMFILAAALFSNSVFLIWMKRGLVPEIPVFYLRSIIFILAWCGIGVIYRWTVSELVARQQA